MVRINRTSHRQFEANYTKSHSFVKRHLFLLSVISFIGLICTVYLVLLNWEVKAHSNMVSSRSVSKLVELGKPFLMYGTAWKEGETARLVQQAVTSGFRFIDTACQPKHYNEAGVGAGWKAAAAELGLDRSGACRCQ